MIKRSYLSQLRSPLASILMGTLSLRPAALGHYRQLLYEYPTSLEDGEHRCEPWARRMSCTYSTVPYERHALIHREIDDRRLSS